MNEEELNGPIGDEELGGEPEEEGTSEEEPQEVEGSQPRDNAYYQRVAAPQNNRNNDQTKSLRRNRDVNPATPPTKNIPSDSASSDNGNSSLGDEIKNTQQKIENTKQKVEKGVENTKKFINLIKKYPWLLWVFLGVIVIAIIIILIVALSGGTISNIGQWNEEGKCSIVYWDSVTKSTDDNADNYVVGDIMPNGEKYVIYEGTLDQYILSTLQREIGALSAYNDNPLLNLYTALPHADLAESYKAFAVISRTYFWQNYKANSDGTCDATKIWQSAGAPQDLEALRETKPWAIEAIEETRGQVLLDDDGNLIWNSMYHACVAKEEDEENVYLNEALVPVPKAWFAKIHKPNKWQDCLKVKNLRHIYSQYGGYYLSSELHYSYTDILNAFYYYNKTISTGSGVLENVDLTNFEGRIVVDNASTHPLKGESLKDFLIRNGTSIDNFNKIIKEDVENGGVRTRSGVVLAAVSFIANTENLGIRIPYRWGGKYPSLGASSDFGAYKPGGVYKKSQEGCQYDPQRPVDEACGSGNSYNYLYDGLDCSGFVSWTFVQAGFKNQDWESMIGAKKLNLDKERAIVGPGDILGMSTSSGRHVVLVIAVDNERKQYLIAESTPGVNGTKGVKFSYYNFYKANWFAYDLTAYYDNPSNYDYKYYDASYNPNNVGMEEG